MVANRQRPTALAEQAGSGAVLYSGPSIDNRTARVLAHCSAILVPLALVLVANAAPPAAAMLLGRWGRPIDGGRTWRDGRPILGHSKTWRGVAVSLAVTSLAAPMLGWDWHLGLGVAVGAMVGDLLASFAKRRLGLGSGASLPLVDQVPEALIPTLWVADGFGLGWWEIAWIVLAFTALDLVLTPLRTLSGKRG